MNSWQYIHALNAVILPFIRKTFGDDHFLFMEDGARIHFASCARAWKDRYLGRENLVPRGMWAPNSPDRNPIEHMWSFMKEYIAHRQPRNLPSLKKCILEAWIDVPLLYIDHMYQSQRHRDELILLKRGAFIGY